MKKEPVEDFSWMGRAPSECHKWHWTLNDAADYEDCRAALDRVEGGRERLKTYVAKEDSMNFRDPIGEQIVLGPHHSGASYDALLWSYKSCLERLGRLGAEAQRAHCVQGVPEGTGQARHHYKLSTTTAQM